jgi:hypothetical protein
VRMDQQAAILDRLVVKITDHLACVLESMRGCVVLLLQDPYIYTEWRY